MRCRYCDTEMDVITVFDAEAKPLKMYECSTCGATSMGELTEAIAKRWEKMFGHLEEELEELKEELEEFEGRDKRIKEEIERHREQMRNWKPRLLRRDADRYGERTDPKP